MTLVWHPTQATVPELKSEHHEETLGICLRHRRHPSNGEEACRVFTERANAALQKVPVYRGHRVVSVRGVLELRASSLVPT
ncbi:hypothetical protein CB1_000637003 [Camelus ferus]|nr:hypothetical protein CB1_000637003 [Camelus ferus]